MLACPKCNFEQPDDRYCANCGVDMESFKSRNPRKILKGAPALYASLVLAVIITTLSLVLSQSKMSLFSEDHLKRVSYSRSELIESSPETKSQRISKKSKTQKNSKKQKALKNKSSPLKQEAPAFGASLAQNTEIQKSEVNKKSPSTTLKISKISKAKPIRLSAHYFTFPTEIWAQFEDDFLQTQNNYGVIRNAKNVILELKKNPNHHILSTPPQNTPQDTSQNTPPPQEEDLNLVYDQLMGENNGIWLRAKTTKTDNGNAQVHFSLQSRFEINSEEETLGVPIENTVTAPSGAAIYFTEPLPQVSLPENSPLLTHPLYRFFGSPEYLEGTSNIQILLELNDF